MWEKAFIGDDGSQVRRKRPVRPCGLTSKGLSLCLFELNYMIRGRTLRDESLETNTARDLIQVVRMFVEMDVGPVSPSSTTQDVRQKSKPLRRAFRNGTLDSNAGRNVKRSADVWGNARHFCDGELNYTGCEAERQKTKKSSQVSSFCFSWIPNHSHCEERSGLNYCILVIAHSPELPLAFLFHLHYHRTNKKKEFFICTRIVFVVIINVFIPGWP